jgi:hypothetical protein
MLALVVLLAINVIFVVDTELAIFRNEFRQAGQDNIWTLGQVLALLLVVLPLKSLLVYLWFSTQLGARFGTKLGWAMKGFREGPDEKTKSAIEKGEDDHWDKVRKWMSTIGDTPGANLNISFTSAAQNHLPVKANLSWMYLAARDGQVDVVRFLSGNIANINQPGRLPRATTSLLTRS